MDALHTALLAGYPMLGVVIATLWRAYNRAQEDRVRMAKEHENVLKSIRTMLERRTL